jgi:alkylated DNA nucleotide flippase Atl1
MPITDYQVAICMALVKIARSMETGKVDTYVDMAAYVAIAGQLHTEENELYV